MAEINLSKYGITGTTEIVHNPSYEKLFEEETKAGLEGYEVGQETELGAVNVMTGIYTGRSPKDKYIVMDKNSKDTVWWTSDEYKNDNHPMTEDTWAVVKDIAKKELCNKRLFVVDAFCGANKDTRMAIRFIVEVAWQAHFVTNMFIKPSAEELENFEPDFVVYNASKAKVANYKELGLNSETCVAFNITSKEQVIINTWYGGEMKKGMFSMMNYFLPLKGMASMHCSANTDLDGKNTAIFFGLSGTGKTTLSTDPKRLLIGDDEHGWDDNGVFNFEGGCYAKVINLDKDSEPDIYNAIKRNALLENVTLDKDGKIDFAIFGRQMLADPDFAQKCMNGDEAQIRRCLRCYKCFPGSPEEGYDDLPFTSEQLAVYVGHCTINPMAHLPFDIEQLPAAEKGSQKVLIVGGGIAGIQAAITAAERGHKVTLAEKSDKLGGLLYFTDVDIDKPDLRNFKDMMIREVKRHDVEILMNTEVTPEFVKEFAPDAVILATGSVPACPPIKGIEHAHQAMAVYDGTCEPGKKVVMIGGGLVGCETGLYLQKTGHEVTVVEMLDRVANESFGMYREALVWEMEKNDMTMLPKTKCLEITPNSVKIENADGVQELPADTVLYALGMKSVDYSALKEAAGEAEVFVIGDAIHPGKVDQCTRTGYIAALKVGASEESVAYIQE